MLDEPEVTARREVASGGRARMNRYGMKDVLISENVVGALQIVA
jgi:hypothetical protein